MQQAVILVLITFMLNRANNSFYKLHAFSFEGNVIKICIPIKFIETFFFKYALVLLLSFCFCIIYRVSYLSQEIYYGLLTPMSHLLFPLILTYFRL